jgi:hypothetical protein
MIERQTVMIVETDLEQRRITVIDKTSRRFQLDLPFADAAQSIPAPDEVWSIYRDNGYQWFLDKRQDAGDDRVPLDSMQPGDTRVRAKGTLHLDAAELLLNGQQIGVTTWERFILQTENSAVVLSRMPISLKTVQVYFNGVLQDPSTYFMGGEFQAELELGFNIVNEDNTIVVVYYQYNPES